MPTTIDITIGEQKRVNCYLIASINAVAHWDPSLLEAMVRPDPDNENYVVVRVATGTYRLPATLPVDEAGDPAHATSLDGSTLVAYIEKAAAAHLGSWDQTDLGVPAFALRWLIGDKLPNTYSFNARSLSDDNRRSFQPARSALSPRPSIHRTKEGSRS